MARPPRIKNLRFERYKEKDLTALEEKLSLFETTIHTAKDHFDKLAPKSQSMLKHIENVRGQVETQLDIYKKRVDAEKALGKTQKDLTTYSGILKDAAKEFGKTFSKFGSELIGMFDDILDTFLGPVWRFVKGIGGVLGQTLGRLGKATFEKFGLMRGQPKEAGGMDRLHVELVNILRELEKQTMSQTATDNSIKAGIETMEESAYERNKDLMDALGGKKKGLLGGILGGIGGLFKGLFGGGVGSLIKRLGGVALIATAVIWMIKDFIKGFAKGGITGGLAMAFAGKAEGGLKNAFVQAGKWAMLGAGIGMVGGPVGILVGGLLGAAIGGVLGFLGSDKVKAGLDFLVSIGKKVWDFMYNKIIQPIVDFFKPLFTGEMGFMEFAAMANQKLAMLMMQAFQKLGELAKPVVDWIWSLPEKIEAAIGNIFDVVVDAIKGIPGKIAEWLQEMNLLDKLTWLDQAMMDLMRGIWEKIKGVFLGGFSSIGEKFKEAGGAIKDFFTGGGKEPAREFQRMPMVTMPGMVAPVPVQAKQAGGDVERTGLVTVHQGEEIRPAEFSNFRYEAALLDRIGDRIVDAIRETGREDRITVEGGNAPITLPSIGGIDDMGLLFVNSALI